MTAEIHRSVEDSDHLQGIARMGEENDVFFIAGGATAPGQVITQPEGVGFGLNRGEPCSKTFQIPLLLLKASVLNSVLGNGMEITNRGRRENQIHRLLLTNRRNPASS